MQRFGVALQDAGTLSDLVARKGPMPERQLAALAVLRLAHASTRRTRLSGLREREHGIGRLRRRAGGLAYRRNLQCFDGPRPGLTRLDGLCRCSCCTGCARWRRSSSASTATSSPRTCERNRTGQDTADRPADRPTDRGIRCLRTTQRSCSTAATVPPPCPLSSRQALGSTRLISAHDRCTAARSRRAHGGRQRPHGWPTYERACSHAGGEELRCRQVLLNYNGWAKISDFGLSRSVAHRRASPCNVCAVRIVEYRAAPVRYHAVWDTIPCGIP
jgi:hypothetical protein